MNRRIRNRTYGGVGAGFRRRGLATLLQIRSSRLSKTWAQGWKDVQEVMYKKAA